MNPHNSKSLPNTDVLSEIPLRHLKTVIITFESFLQKKHTDHYGFYGSLSPKWGKTKGLFALYLLLLSSNSHCYALSISNRPGHDPDAKT